MKSKQSNFPPLSKTDIFFQSHKMMGAWIPIPMADHLSLHCVVNQIARSKILTEQIKKYVAQLDKPNDLIFVIKKQLLKNWTRRCEDETDAGNIKWQTFSDLSERWEEYKDSIRAGLRKQKVSVRHIEQIIDEVEDSLK